MSEVNEAASSVQQAIKESVKTEVAKSIMFIVSVGIPALGFLLPVKWVKSLLRIIYFHLGNHINLHLCCRFRKNGALIPVEQFIYYA